MNPAILLVANLPAVTCFVCAGYLCYHEKPYWGWFLFVGVLCLASVKVSSGNATS